MKKLIASFIKGIGSIVVINPKIRNKKIKDIFNRSDSEALYSDQEAVRKDFEEVFRKRL